MSCSIPRLSPLQADPWWSQKWGLALHRALLRVPLCAAGDAPISTKALCAVLMCQPILGSPSVINIRLQTAAPQDSLF